MPKIRMRRGESPPPRDSFVVRGLADGGRSHPFDRDLLRTDATLNHDAYGFFGLSVWLVEAEWPLTRVLAEKLASAARVALLGVGDLYDAGLELWDTGMSPHHDLVPSSATRASDLVDRLLAVPCFVVNNDFYVQDPDEGDSR